jgi:hypothetical protein
VQQTILLTPTKFDDLLVFVRATRTRPSYRRAPIRAEISSNQFRTTRIRGL